MHLCEPFLSGAPKGAPCTRLKSADLVYNNPAIQPPVVIWKEKVTRANTQMIFTDECMLMSTVITRYLGLQVWTEQNTEINLHLNDLHLECNDNKRQKTSWKKYQMTESWRKLTIFERENLQCLLSIKYVEKHNGKNYTVGKHKERTTQDILLLQIYFKKRIGH